MTFSHTHPNYYCRTTIIVEPDKKAKRPSLTMAPLHLPGDVLLSQDPSVQVSSALEVLTSVFGMGTGGTPPVLSPDLLLSRFCV